MKDLMTFVLSILLCKPISNLLINSSFSFAFENPKKFGHYLDCEAHTDVWRELFKTYNHTNCLGEE